MSDKETLHFKIGLSKSSGKKQPKFRILVNNTEFVCAELSSDAHTIEYFEFDASVDDGECSLVVEFLNKSLHDTVLDVHGNMIEDLLLNIESVEIDEIDLGFLIWTSSDYYPNYPRSYLNKMLALGNELPDTVKNCVNLGWNGRWKLSFTSPFYIWLLENI